MQITINNTCPSYNSYRAERVKAMFNVTDELSTRFSASVSLPLEEKAWSIGAVIGGSGTGKTSLGKRLFDGGAFHEGYEWPSDCPIIDAMGGGLDFKKVTAALTSVGLGSVPSWLKPFHVLSQGEKFRAELARIILESPESIVID